MEICLRYDHLMGLYGNFDEYLCYAVMIVDVQLILTSDVKFLSVSLLFNHPTQGDTSKQFK